MLKEAYEAGLRAALEKVGADSLEDLQDRYTKALVEGPTSRGTNATIGLGVGGAAGAGLGALAGIPARVIDGAVRRFTKLKGTPLPYAAYPAGGAAMGAFLGAAGMGLQNPQDLHRKKMDFLHEKMQQAAANQ